MGGWSGTVVAAIPLVVFVLVNAITELRPAIIAALASGVLVAGYRLVRHQPVQQALTGLFSVVIAAAIAARTGQARGFFLLGIVGAVVYAAVFLLSLVFRRPLVGVLWEYLEPSPLPAGTRWYRVPKLRRAYDIATCAGLAMFAARAVVQLSLFRDNRTGWLAITKLAMGFPLYIAVVGVAFWVVRRTRRQLGLHVAPVEDLAPAEDLAPGEDLAPEEDLAPAEGLATAAADPGAGTAAPTVVAPVNDAAGPELGGADRAPDGRLGLGQCDE